MKLETINLSVSKSGQDILRSVDVKVEAGKLIGLIGPNGAGKSTLLRVLAGLNEPSSGAVKFDNTELSKLSLKERSQKIAYLPQDKNLHWNLTVKDLVALGRHPYRRPFSPLSDADLDAVETAMSLMDISEWWNRSALKLSGGEFARVLMARALAQQPQILLADEPTAALDPAHQIRLLKLLRHSTKSGLGAVLALHDLSLAAQFCDELVMLVEGDVFMKGSAEEVLTKSALEQVYGISADIKFIDDKLTVTPLDIA